MEMEGRHVTGSCSQSKTVELFKGPRDLAKAAACAGSSGELSNCEWVRVTSFSAFRTCVVWVVTGAIAIPGFISAGGAEGEGDASGVRDL